MFSDFASFMVQIWHHQPIILILLGGGLICFVLIVIDTHRHRKKIKKARRPDKMH